MRAVAVTLVCVSLLAGWIGFAAVETAASSPAAPAEKAAEALKPKPAKRVQPRVPKKAAREKQEGNAVVLAEVGPDGEVLDVTLVSETPEGFGFGEAAVDCLREWEFESGRPGTYRTKISFYIL